MPDKPTIEERGPFRILRHGGSRWLVCARCVPDNLNGLLDIRVYGEDNETEQYLAEQMDRHITEAHPPTIPGHLADVHPGWRGLLMDLHVQLLEVNPGYRISSLAQDAGELRVAMASVQSQAVEALLEAATAASREVCVFCGEKPARPTPGFRSGVLMCCEAHGG